MRDGRGTGTESRKRDNAFMRRGRSTAAEYASRSMAYDTGTTTAVSTTWTEHVATSQQAESQAR
ncbi:MAG: hypothetical protein PHW58_06375 [Candidatus Methanofastidiosa archaeon]|nr:hypothetical protein [Candidatus Methanofastidiosa archaeon]